MDILISPVDERVLSLVLLGCSSPYAMWVQTKREGEWKSGPLKPLPYKTINQRVRLLNTAGLLELIKTKDTNIHGRKDFRITDKGIDYLVDYILQHPEHVKTLAEYMDKYKLDNKRFGTLLLRSFFFSTKELFMTISEYQKHTNILQSIDVDNKVIELFLNNLDKTFDLYDEIYPEEEKDDDYYKELSENIQSIEEFAKSKLQKRTKN